MLTLINVEVFYLNVIMVLRGVSLEVGDGKIVALLGGNGAGKSTTLNAISGLLVTEDGKVTDGTIQMDGVQIANIAPDYIAKLGIVQVQEGRRIFEHLTVDQNMMVGAYMRRDRAEIKRDLDMMYEIFPRLSSNKNKAVGYISGGEQQMLVVGRALMSQPRIMLLDEPSLGLAPLLVQDIFNQIRRINEEQKTSILLVEQNVRAALDIASYGYVMENGKIVLDGSAEKLNSNEDIREFYLGLTELGQRKSYRDVKHYKRRKRWL